MSLFSLTIVDVRECGLCLGGARGDENTRESAHPDSAYNCCSSAHVNSPTTLKVESATVVMSDEFSRRSEPIFVIRAHHARRSIALCRAHALVIRPATMPSVAALV